MCRLCLGQAGGNSGSGRRSSSGVRASVSVRERARLPQPESLSFKQAGGGSGAGLCVWWHVSLCGVVRLLGVTCIPSISQAERGGSVTSSMNDVCLIPSLQPRLPSSMACIGRRSIAFSWLPCDMCQKQTIFFYYVYIFPIFSHAPEQSQKKESLPSTWAANPNLYGEETCSMRETYSVTDIVGSGQIGEKGRKRALLMVTGYSVTTFLASSQLSKPREVNTSMYY